MKSAFYRTLVRLTGVLGPWFFKLVSRGIAVGYLLSGPQKALAGVRFFARAFPGRSRAFHVRTVAGQYMGFTDVFLDRLSAGASGTTLAHTFEGWERMSAAMTANRGCILLMSHMGSWEVAAKLLRQYLPEADLMLVMGIRREEQIEGIQKEGMGKAGTVVVGRGQAERSPFDLVETARFLKNGGTVSMTGDKVWHEGQRTVSVDFLGSSKPLPEAPFALALASGSPLFPFFCLKTGPGRYHLTAHGPMVLDRKNRGDRARIVRRAAQKYADLLQETLLRHPQQWYHFDPFV